VEVKIAIQDLVDVKMHVKLTVVSLVMVLLTLFTTNAPFDTRSNQLESDTRKSIRKKLAAGDNPFPDTKSDVSNIVSTLMEHLQRDPFLRPTAGSLAQTLFELVLRRATIFSSENTLQDISLHDIHVLAKDILSKVEKAKAISKLKATGEQVAIEKIRPSELTPLISAAQQSDPSMSFLLGIAYLWNVVDIEDRGNSQSRVTPYGRFSLTIS
jgi:serine/threonine protein kinase